MLLEGLLLEVLEPIPNLQGDRVELAHFDPFLIRLLLEPLRLDLDHPLLDLLDLVVEVRVALDSREARIEGRICHRSCGSTVSK